jgi:hypothetical protein
VIDKALDAGDYVGARKLIRGFLAENPADHWLLARMGAAYAWEGKLVAGRKWTRRALKISPRCPIALWHMASIATRQKQYAEAARILRGLVARREISFTRAGVCSQSRSWARTFVTDCCWQLAYVEYSRCRLKDAARAMQRYVTRRSAGSRTVVGGTLRVARVNLAMLKDSSS